MGAIETKKDGALKKYELPIDLKRGVLMELEVLCNWSFADIKRTYDGYCRKTDSPFIDFFTFHKIMPFSMEICRQVFDSFTQKFIYLNMFELICMLLLLSHNSYRKKLQMVFIIFDFNHKQHLTNKQLLLIFDCFANGWCRVTGQSRPQISKLDNYTFHRFIRVSTPEVMTKKVDYRRIIEQIEGNQDAFALFGRFDHEEYGYFHQQTVLFRLSGYKKYTQRETQKIYRIVRRANNDGNFEEVELQEKNKLFRLQNRKIQCIKSLLEEKQERLRPRANTMHPGLGVRSGSLMSLSNRTQPLGARTQPLGMTQRSPSSIKLASTFSSKKGDLPHRRVLILNGKITSKQDIFDTVRYFKTLAGGKPEIRMKQFNSGFEKKPFMKKQVNSLYKYFDQHKKGEVTFQDFLKVYYRGISQRDINTIVEWAGQYHHIHQADQFDISQYLKKKEKKAHIDLPKSTLIRIDEIFNSIDRGMKGYLSLQDLKKAYSPGFTIKQMEDMMRDFGKNGKIYKDEFIAMTLPEDWTIIGTDYVGV